MNYQKSIFWTLIVAVSLSTAGCAQQRNSSSTETTPMDSISYALGILFANNLQSQGLNEIETNDMASGLADQMAGTASLTPEEANIMVGEFFKAKKEAESAEYKKECEDFLEANAGKEGIQTTASGLQYIHITEGEGEAPTAASNVTVHYRGTLIDGTEFDSSYSRGEPTSFPLGGVIRGWTEGLQLMKPGGKTRFFIPQELAYGANPNPNSPIKPYAALIFEVELISVQ
ncbi:MAG: FKBP-type peptidyl-prolyl cis-trans isomerase [Bacteroidetes bacterium]|nr:FKBP-type peptidyl-prolyl cis-trans isomerase [Bacteroidota bacterium]MDA1336233.1 FKBP-type peptidyl-prolyl cis-trans isomerase [Bacteroidota bacterium]